jgi:hypothetical protein
MPTIITAETEPLLSSSFTFLKGEFSLWGYSIPYFSCVIPLARVASYFHLIEQIPDEVRMEWSLEELFQRDIAWDRVDDEIVKYLRNENRPQFFNSLTIALLPSAGHGFSADYGEEGNYHPMQSEGLDKPIIIGGIQIQGFQGQEGRVGRIRWDTNRIQPIAVDGQHRLAAIKRLVEKKIANPESLERSTISVILLVPHEKVGFVAPKASAAGIASHLRDVFIDLNKNARQVSAARRILLDDSDIVSVCTRSVIGSKLSAEDEPDRVPLPLVDWMSEKNKIETGPFITTVLLLYSILKKGLDVKPRDEVTEDDPRVARWLKNVFAPSDPELEELMSQVRRCYNQEIPLSFTQNEIELLRNLFEKRWRPLIYRVFREVTPYRKVWDFRSDEKLLSPGFVNLYIAEETASKPGKRRSVEHAKRRSDEIVNQIKMADPDWNKNRRYVQPLSHIDQSIKENNWAYKIVFQRGLFESFFTLLEQASLFVGDTDDERSAFTTRWIDAVNRLFDTDLCLTTAKFGKPSDDFWKGIGKRADGPIDFTMASSSRIANWLNAWVGLCSMEDVPTTFGALEKSEEKMASLVAQALSIPVVTKGLDALAEAQGDDSEAVDHRNRRYKHLRKLITK